MKSLIVSESSFKGRLASIYEKQAKAELSGLVKYSSPNVPKYDWPLRPAKPDPMLKYYDEMNRTSFLETVFHLAVIVMAIVSLYVLIKTDSI